MAASIASPRKNVGRRNLPFHLNKVDWVAWVHGATGVARSTTAPTDATARPKLGLTRSSPCLGQGLHRPITSSPLPSPFPQPAQRPLGGNYCWTPQKAAAGKVQRNSPFNHRLTASTSTRPQSAATGPRFRFPFFTKHRSASPPARRARRALPDCLFGFPEYPAHRNNGVDARCHHLPPEPCRFRQHHIPDRAQAAQAWLPVQRHLRWSVLPFPFLISSSASSLPPQLSWIDVFALQARRVSASRH